MDSKLTPFDKIIDCIKGNQDFVLQGGAGSGKTETLKQLLEYISENYTDKKIACITHTNLAVEEIKSRVGDGYTISTIHSFLNRLIKNYKKNIKSIINLIFQLEKIQRHDIGYYNNDEKKQKKEEYDRYKKLYKKYSDKTLSISGEYTEKVIGKRVYDKSPEEYNNHLNDKIDNLNSAILESINQKDIINIEYNETKFDNLNELSYGHDSLLKIASLLFEKYPRLGKILVDKYDFIFVDEYQDTNGGILDTILRKLPSKNKTIIGLFGDSMQAIYDDGIGDVESYIEKNFLVKIEKEDNYRCSEQVVRFVNQLRIDGLKQKVAYKKDENGYYETISDRQGKVKLYYSIYDGKPSAFSSKEHKNDYLTALNRIVKIARDEQLVNKCLMLTNKSISQKAGFKSLYETFSTRYIEPQEYIDKHLTQLQLLDLYELCNAFNTKNNNFLLNKLKTMGFSLKKLSDKKWISDSLNQIIYSEEGAIDTLNNAFEIGLLKKSDKHLEYVKRKDAFIKKLNVDEEYNEFKYLYSNGYHTLKKINEKKEFQEEEFKELEKNLKKECFYNKLFSNNIKFKEVLNYFSYLNEETDYITMHKTKGSGIDNVLVVMEDRKSVV